MKFLAFPIVLALGLVQPVLGDETVTMVFPDGYVNNADICLSDSITGKAPDHTPIYLAQADGSYKTVDQLIDASALSPYEMFRFIPDYVEIKPGESITFENSFGPHTVHSVDGMLPEGAMPFAIENRGAAEVKFEKSGVYGIRCKVHGRYGMVMLVKVGDGLSNLAAAQSVKHGQWPSEKFRQLFEKLTVTQ